jgi:hypothetical protein
VLLLGEVSFAADFADFKLISITMKHVWGIVFDVGCRAGLVIAARCSRNGLPRDVSVTLQKKSALISVISGEIIVEDPLLKLVVSASEFELQAGRI